MVPSGPSRITMRSPSRRSMSECGSLNVLSSIEHSTLRYNLPVPPRVIEYHHVTQNITRPNIAAARHFYGEILGLREIPTMGDPAGQRLIWFALGSKQLHLIIRDQAEPGSSRHIAVYVDDFEAMI